jgi:pimeloyl-ACP methyl ester carboxylesterase
MLLFVFVHGFLGSEESFESFPLDLESFMNNQSCPCQSKIYPKYDTKGNNQRQVIALVDWLLLNATTVQYSKVILLAHSMGGLLAVDAYRQLYSDSSVRGLVNIRGIISLDSPFFGIVPSVLTDINNIPPQFVSKSIESISTAMGSSFNAMNTPAGWAQMILTTAAVGTTLMTMPRTAINGIAVKAAEQVRHHLEFLYPLAESSVISSERMKILEKEFDEQRLFFRGFYVQVIA